MRKFSEKPPSGPAAWRSAAYPCAMSAEPAPRRCLAASSRSRSASPPAARACAGDRGTSRASSIFVRRPGPGSGTGFDVESAPRRHRGRAPGARRRVRLRVVPRPDAARALPGSRSSSRLGRARPTPAGDRADRPRGRSRTVLRASRRAPSTNLVKPFLARLSWSHACGTHLPRRSRSASGEPRCAPDGIEIDLLTRKDKTAPGAR